MITFRAIHDWQGGSLSGHVIQSSPQFSRHHESPPLFAEWNDRIGCYRRQIRATSFATTEESHGLQVNEYGFLVIAK